MTHLTIPYQFIAGTKAKASEVNANFNAVVTEIDAVYAQILSNSNTNSASITSLTTSINNVDDKIDNFLDTFSETPKFCINKGKLNSSGEPNILNYNSTVISFNVDSDNPMTATTQSGKTFTLEEIDDLTLPTLTDGTYTIYVNEEGTVNYYTSTVQKVKTLPSSPYANEVCLLIGTEPIKAYKYSGTEWETFSSVPVGEFVISNATISSIQTLPYNQNGYDINSQSFCTNFTQNGWLKMPNGLIFQWGKYTFTASQTLNFPIAFPNSCLGAATGGNPDGVAASAHVNISVVSASQFVACCGMPASSGVGGSTYIFAYGYQFL